VGEEGEEGEEGEVGLREGCQSQGREYGRRSQSHGRPKLLIGVRIEGARLGLGRESSPSNGRSGKAVFGETQQQRTKVPQERKLAELILFLMWRDWTEASGKASSRSSGRRKVKEQRGPGIEHAAG
jgi:hypothetical protein